MTKRIVDLVGSRVEEILALEIDLGTSEFLSEAFCKIKWGWAPNKLLQKGGKFVAKGWILSRRIILVLQFEQCRHQSFWNKTPPIRTKVSVLVGKTCEIALQIVR